MARFSPLKQILLATTVIATAACYGRLPDIPPLPTPPPTDGPPAQTAASPGQYAVGLDIEPGRYFSGPAFSNCVYSMEGAGPSVRTAVGFVPRQWIVDILPSDKTFKTSSDCGKWSKESPRLGLQSSIPPGLWLVGSQVAPGTYETDAFGECYFLRLRDFHSIEGRSVIEVGGMYNGSLSVTIEAADIGFMTNTACGTWSRQS